MISFTPPVSAMPILGTPVTFAVQVSGTEAVSIQWDKDGTPLPGATGPVLALPVVTRQDAGLYQARVTEGSQTFDTEPFILEPVTRAWVVRNLATEGPSSLAQIIADAAASPGLNGIQFQLPPPASGALNTPQVLALSSDLPPITGQICILGPAQTQLVLDGGHSHRPFLVDGGTLILDNFTVANGLGKGGNGPGGGGGAAGMGGAIFINKGSVALTRMTFQGNTALGGDGGYGQDGQNGGGGGFGGDAPPTLGNGAGGGLLGGIGGSGYLNPFMNQDDGGGPALGDGAGGGATRGGLLATPLSSWLAFLPGGAGSFGGGGGFSVGPNGTGGLGGVPGGGGGGSGGAVLLDPAGPMLFPGGTRALGGPFGGNGGLGTVFGNPGRGGAGAGLGGAIFLRDGTLSLAGCTFVDNHAVPGQGDPITPAQGKGGAIFVFEQAPGRSGPALDLAMLNAQTYLLNTVTSNPMGPDVDPRYDNANFFVPVQPWANPASEEPFSITFIAPPSAMPNLGTPVTFGLRLFRGTAPTIQWEKDGQPLPGATGNQLTIRAVARADAGLYQAVVTDGSQQLMTPPFILEPVNQAWTVTNLATEGTGSLAQALSLASAAGGFSGIQFQLPALAGAGPNTPVVIPLAADLPPITGQLCLLGPVQPPLVLDGGHAHRPFLVNGGTLVLDNFTVANGLGKGGNGPGGGGGAAGMGGAIFINQGSVTLTRMTFNGNQAIGGTSGPGSDGENGGGGGFGGDAPAGQGTGAGGGVLGGFGGVGALNIAADQDNGGAPGLGDGAGGGAAVGGLATAPLADWLAGLPGGTAGFGAGGGFSVGPNGVGGLGGFPGGGGGGTGGQVQLNPGGSLGFPGGISGPGGPFGGSGGLGDGQGHPGLGGGGAGLGGAIFLRNGLLAMANCHFSNNQAIPGQGDPAVPAQGKGGAIFVYEHDATSSGPSVDMAMLNAQTYSLNTCTNQPNDPTLNPQYDNANFYVPVQPWANPMNQEPLSVTLIPPPSAMPINGSSVTLTVKVFGGRAPTIQWTKDGQALPGSTAPQLILAAVSPADAGLYQAQVTDGAQQILSPSFILEPVDQAWTVTSLAGDGSPGSLTYALGMAAATAGFNGIQFQLPPPEGATPSTPMVIPLTSGLPAITGQLCLLGPIQTPLVLDCGLACRPFFVNGGTLVLDNFTVANGLARGGNGPGGGGGAAGMGGAVFINAGTVTLTRMIFKGNEAIGGDSQPGSDGQNGGGGGFGGDLPAPTNGDGEGGGLLGGIAGPGYLDPMVNDDQGGGDADGDGAGGGAACGGILSLSTPYADWLEDSVSSLPGGEGGFGGGGGFSVGPDGGGGNGGYPGGGGGGSGGAWAFPLPTGLFEFTGASISLGGVFGGDGGVGDGLGHQGRGGGGAGMGGAIFFRNGTLTLAGCSFVGNQAIPGQGDPTNPALGKGGAVFIYRHPFGLDGPSFDMTMLQAQAYSQNTCTNQPNDPDIDPTYDNSNFYVPVYPWLDARPKADPRLRLKIHPPRQ